MIMEQENSSPIHKIIIISFLAIVTIGMTIFSIWILNRANRIRNAVTYPPTETVYSRGHEIVVAVDKAYEYIEEGKYQAVINLIAPQVESWSYSMNQADAYEVLILAELKLSNAEAAVAYAETLTTRHISSYSYQLLGQAYELNQQYDKAYEAYTNALASSDHSPRTNREYIKEHRQIVIDEMNPK
jgi:tetratricopeptide (TPR) repeat protein